MTTDQLQLNNHLETVDVSSRSRQQLYQDTFTNLEEKGKALLSSGQSKQEENHTKEEARDAASV